MEWQSEINKQQRELVALQAALPSSVNLGLTSLHLGKVRMHSQALHLGEGLHSQALHLGQVCMDSQALHLGKVCIHRYCTLARSAITGTAPWGRSAITGTAPWQGMHALTGSAPWQGLQSQAPAPWKGMHSQAVHLGKVCNHRHLHLGKVCIHRHCTWARPASPEHTQPTIE